MLLIMPDRFPPLPMTWIKGSEWRSNRVCSAAASAIFHHDALLVAALHALECAPVVIATVGSDHA
jgi:hypothetical protein